MAKLTAHGTELARLVKSMEPSELTTESTYHVSIRSDGAILKKHTVKFKPLPMLGETVPKSHDYGWKLAIRHTVIPVVELIKAYTDRGYKLQT